jgi:hypothetical protein
MPTVDALKQRLNAIADSLKNSGQAYALLGLGSAGCEQNRMDAYSDLDFFAIVKEGQKQHFIQNLFWLTDIAPAGFHFQNTADGHKFLYQDGIFCEFAVFEPHELATIPFAEGEVIWAESDFDTKQLKPLNHSGSYERSDNVDWILGEALTNLYVGLGRYCRGEKLSGFKFVQSFALDRLVDLIYLTRDASTVELDQYMPDRRLEQRFAGIESEMTQFAQGYSKTPESALAQLDWLEQNFSINPVIADEIRTLAHI